MGTTYRRVGHIKKIKIEIVSFGLVIIGIILSIYLLLKNFTPGKSASHIDIEIWKMLTSYSNARSIPILNNVMFSSLVVGFFLASTLKKDVFIWIIVLFLVHIWGAER